MRLFHGMNVDRREAGWDIEKIGRGNDQEGPGFYFTDERTDAERYGSHLHVCEINTKKCITVRRKTNYRALRKLLHNAPNLDDSLTNWDENRDVALVLAWRALCNCPNYWDALTQVWYDFYRGHEPVWARNVVSLCGVDGYLVPRKKNNGTQHVVVLNPEIITILYVVHTENTGVKTEEGAETESV